VRLIIGYKVTFRSSNFASLQIKQWKCCSSTMIPSPTLQLNTDVFCFFYFVKKMAPRSRPCRLEPFVSHHFLIAASIHVTELHFGILCSSWRDLIIAASGIQEEFNRCLHYSTCLENSRRIIEARSKM
jgi:hypothetical protein